MTVGFFRRDRIMREPCEPKRRCCGMAWVTPASTATLEMTIEEEECVAELGRPGRPIMVAIGHPHLDLQTEFAHAPKDLEGFEIELEPIMVADRQEDGRRIFRLRQAVDHRKRIRGNQTGGIERRAERAREDLVDAGAKHGIRMQARPEGAAEGSRRAITEWLVEGESQRAEAAHR